MILHHLNSGLVGCINSPALYLEQSDLKDFLSILHDTTLATSKRGQNEQLLDVFYGTLIVCMIRSVLSLTFRYTRTLYKPLHSQANPDPTFLDGPKSQIYEPMLLLLESSMSTIRGENAQFSRSAAAIATSTFDDGGRPPPKSMSMYTHAVWFISLITRHDPLRPQFES